MPSAAPHRPGAASAGPRPADLVFLAMGFTGAQREGLVEGLGVELDQRGNVARDGEFMSTVPGPLQGPAASVRAVGAGGPSTELARGEEDGVLLPS